MLDASGAVAEAAGFDFFESREAFGEALIKQAVDRHQYQFDQPAWPWFSRRNFGVEPAIADFAVATSEADTRTQVAGVAESDLFQSSDTHIFVAAGNRLNVFGIEDPANPESVGSVMLDSNIQGMFLDGTTLSVVSTEVFYYYLHGAGNQWTPSTTVTVFDVADPANPELTSQTTLDGRYVESRSIDGNIHVITSHLASLPGPRQIPIEDVDGDGEVSSSAASGGGLLRPETQLVVDSLSWGGGEPTHVFESREDYERWIRDNIDSFIDEVLPQYEITLADGSAVTGPITEATAIPQVTDGFVDSIMTVATLDPQMQEPGIVDSASVFIEPDNTVYATQENLYVAASDWASPEQQTNILQFSWGTDTEPMQLVATGTVRGQLLNQFAMDEHDGYLRVATSITRRAELSNFVYVLQANGTALDQVGAIEDFEQGEQIFAVRFDGDQAFVVTFEQIDPLFILDLSDPANPTITGALEVPGVSNHLVRIDENHLLAIGRLGRDTKVTVYDISDTTSPTLVDEDLLPAGAWSPANWDHMAFGWYPELKLLAIPTSGRGHIGLSTFTVDVTASGEDVIHDAGFLATEQHIDRSTYIGETLFAIGPYQITSTTVEDPHIQVGFAETAQLELDVSEIRPVVMLQTTFMEDAEAPMTVVLGDSLGASNVVLDGDTLTVTNSNGEQSFELERNSHLVLKGSAGEDSISIDFSNAAPGVLKSFRVNAGLGDDVVTVTALPQNLQRSRIHVGDGADIVEVLKGVRQKVLIFGGSGDDTLSGGAGNDVINGGDGDDQLVGNDGHDRLIGRRGSDHIRGLNGNDTVLGGRSEDRLYGGRGADLIRGGRGNDLIYGSNGADVLTGNAGDDRVFGGHGADSLLDIAFATINDHFEGGGGRDRFVGGNVPLQQVIDRLFDFSQTEDLISELWRQ